MGVPLLVADACSLRLDEDDMKDEGGAPSLVRCCGRCACWQLTCCCLLLLGWVRCRGFVAPWMLRRASVQSDRWDLPSARCLLLSLSALLPTSAG